MPDNDLRQLLADHGILARELTVTPLEGGGGNTVLLLEADGRRLVLRRYERIAPKEAEFELALSRALTERGFPTQPLVERTDGALASYLSGRPAAIFEYVGGTEPTPGSPQTAQSLTATVARMHVITQELEIPNCRAWTDVVALSRLEELARDRGGEIKDPLWPRLLDDCRKLRTILDERVFPRDAELPKGIIHHDLHPGNVLVGETGEVVLLDFDEAQFGWLALDLASLIRYWGMDGEWDHVDPAKAASLLAIYDRDRAICQAERELLPEMMKLFFLGDALGFILPRLTRDPTSPAITECHAYERFLWLDMDLAAATPPV